jgi:ABC-2 type transport system ATP-binding protein
VIAEGTSDELKARVGGERLEVRLHDPAEAGQAVEALADLADGDRPRADGPLVIVPTLKDGTVAEAVRRLDAAGVAIDDLATRRPTLDDVFLTLTGHAAEEGAGDD